MKISTLSNKLSHLFNQGTNSAELILSEPTSVKKLKMLIDKKADAELSQKLAKPIQNKRLKEALSLDENRADFVRVPWGTRGAYPPDDEKGNKGFEQVWFAGNHSDIGGSYPETESRLSDIALEWMVDAATSIPHPIQVDRSVLRLYPASEGMQHDECKVGIKWITRWTSKTWKRAARELPDPDSTLHPSVLERFSLPEVLHYDVMEPYRPVALAKHKDFREHSDYASLSLPSD